jgi:Na+(H+)/acetate symporter ActP
VTFGGMLATTWVQIIKAVLLLTCVVVLGIWVLGRFDFNPSDVLARAAARSGEGDAYLGPGLFFVKPLDSASTGLAFALGTAGLPHILMRFYTVPDARAARGSAGWAALHRSLLCLRIDRRLRLARAARPRGREARGHGPEPGRSLYRRVPRRRRRQYGW